jgi:hypothetical protein
MTAMDSVTLRVEIDRRVHLALSELAAAAELSMDAVVEAAARAHVQCLVGDPAVALPGRAGQFRKEFSDRDAAVVIRQKNPTQFELQEPFRYVGPLNAESGERDEWLVDIGDVTDLASIPNLLTWLVPRYGRHSLPALLHDHLQHATGVTSARADAIFRDTMHTTKVPFARRWAMWAAVSLRTLVGVSGLWWFPIVLWVLVYGIGVGLVAVWWALGVVSLSTALAVAAIGFVSPAITSVLWGSNYRVGLIAGLGFMVTTLAVAIVALASSVYALIELICKRFVKDPSPICTRTLAKQQSEPR